MPPTELYQEIINYCRANADPAIVTKYARYFTEGYDAYGLGKGVLEAKVDEILVRDKITIELVYTLGDLLIVSHKYEETYFATHLLKHFTDKFSSATFTAVGHWFEIGIVNWAHCDVVCRDVTGPLLKNKVIDIAALATWRGAANTYQRRAVPVTLIEILPDTENFTPLLDLIEPLMHDTAKKVQQGLGWFLRETWKFQPTPVEAFLLKYKDTAPRLIYQYACEKMGKEEKQRFKKIKSLN
ncbi:MAG: DNA alkylation repair protein [Candidatus Marinimicrobia bacterium]|nr:DNA alkylation repair protein [Candidatus Neomarinimicrobiota bacterium]